MADIDKDGNVDVLGVCDGPGVGGNAFFCFAGRGDFAFDPPVAYSVGQPPSRLLAEDFDGDTYVDVAVLMPSQNIVVIFRSDGGTLQGQPGLQYSIE